MPTRALIFDFDGTLVDSLADIASSVNHALMKLDCNTLPIEKIQHHIGLGVTQLMSGALGDEKRKLISQGVDFFLQHYVTECIQKTDWYPHVLDTLQLLKKKYKLAIFTNKPKSFTELILKKLNGFSFFDIIICGGDEGIPKKPDPTGIFKIAHHWTLPVSDCIFVGDSLIDIETAKQSNIRLALAAYGFGYPGPDSQCQYRLQSFNDLLLTLG